MTGTDQARRRKRYRLDIARGIDRSPVPAAPTREHLARLVAGGFSTEGIARATGFRVSRPGVSWILNGRGVTVQQATAAALLSVTPRAVIAATPDGGFVPKVGTVRRVQALMTAGWRVVDIDTAAGTCLRVNLYAPDRVLIEARIHRAVTAVYDDRWSTAGPSDRTRARAARCGYAPPLAWDEDTIDDPDARPVGLAGTMATARAALIEDVETLLADGATVHSACARLGRTPKALARSLQRAGRHDLWSRLNGHRGADGRLLADTHAPATEGVPA